MGAELAPEKDNLLGYTRQVQSTTPTRLKGQRPPQPRQPPTRRQHYENELDELYTDIYFFSRISHFKTFPPTIEALRTCTSSHLERIITSAGP